jgi:hypothetical protein
MINDGAGVMVSEKTAEVGEDGDASACFDAGSLEAS